MPGQVVGPHDGAGMRADEVDPSLAVLEQILGTLQGEHADDEPAYDVGEKLTAEQAAYTDDGPEPFVCAECRHIVWDDDERKVWCEVVDGPHDGEIDPRGSCRVWKARSAWTGDQPAPEPEEGGDDDAEHGEPDDLGDGGRAARGR